MAPAELPILTKSMYSSQKKWCDKNWKSTLAEHSTETEKLIEKINIFDIWSNVLHNNEPAKKLIPEIVVDAYMALHFACMGLYKYAYMCLRSQQETVLRLVYFSTHPVEFRWWLNGNEWYRSGLKAKDVWGEGYSYFSNIEIIKEFENKCENENKLFANGNKVRESYRKLSQYVHSSAASFQTRPDSFSPKYGKKEFKIWLETFIEIQDYINIIFMLAFFEKFKNISSTDQKTVLDKGIENKKYKEKIKETLGIQEQI